jgi:hypothetical protein
MDLGSNFVADGSKSTLQNATHLDSKHRVMQQEKLSPQGWLEVLYQTLGGKGGSPLYNLQATRNSKQTVLRPQLTTVVVKHSQLASLQNKKELVTSIFGFKEMQVNNK